MVEFKDGDRVTTRTGPTLGETPITGTVIGVHNVSTTPSGPAFYIVLLDKRIEGFSWSSIVLHGSMLDPLNVLDDILNGEVPCPLCGGDE